MNEIDEAEIVIGQQEAVSAVAQNAAGAAVDNGPSVRIRKKSGDKVARRSVPWGELDHAIAGADMRVTRPVQCHEKTRVEQWIDGPEVFESKRRTVRSEGSVGRGNLFAGFEWGWCTAERHVWIRLKEMSAASSEIGAGRGDASLLAID
jgi:hypothetical protein